jgi:hypothetical protein
VSGQTNQPPALGGEPEVLGYLFRWDYNHGNGWTKNQTRFVESMEHVEHEDQSSFREITPVVSQASIAPLQAEIERLTAERDAQMEVARSRLIGQKRANSDLRKAQARIAELEAGQPATAKVVLPERMELRSSDGSETYETKAWNACIDATAKLNGVTPDEQ